MFACQDHEKFGRTCGIIQLPASWPSSFAALMGSPNLAEVEEKKQSIEIWLHHLKVSQFHSLFFTLLMPHSSIMKSSAKSSHSSLQSAVSTSSLSKAVKSSAKAIRCGVKRIKKGTSIIIHPLKQAKHALSTVSSPVAGNEGNNPSDGDQDTPNSREMLEVIDVDSDAEDLEKYEKELGMHTFLSIS